MTLRILILGAAAGGGLPQWNCGCENCDLARAGKIPALTQSSIAVSAGDSWTILNASPDIRYQLQNAPALHPTGPRSLPLENVMLTNGDIDHVAGLLTLREQQPFNLLATAEIHRILGENPIFNAVNPDVVPRKNIALNTPFDLGDGLRGQLFSVPGKVPLYNEGDKVITDLEGEQTVGVEFSAGGKRMYYIPGCARVTPALADRIKGADMLMFDGTLWRDDEMIRAGLSQKTGGRMGHISMSGADGSIKAIEPLKIAQKVYVHMNNTNPVLRPDSDERRAAEAEGWVIAADGMELSL